MIEVLAPPQLRIPLAASALLHAGVVLLLFLKFVPPTPPIPIGVEVRYSEPAIVKAAPKARRVERGDIPAKEKIRTELETPTPVQAQPVDAPAGRADGAIVTAKERYIYELRLFLESRKVYPESARRLHQTGTVIVRFKVDAEGALINADVEQPSQSEVLNRAALDLIKRASRFKPLPQETKTSELTITLPIEYIL